MLDLFASFSKLKLVIYDQVTSNYTFTPDIPLFSLICFTTMYKSQEIGLQYYIQCIIYKYKDILFYHVYNYKTLVFIFYI